MASNRPRFRLTIAILGLLVLGGVSCSGKQPPAEPADSTSASMPSAGSGGSASTIDEEPVEDVQDNWRTAPKPEVEKVPPQTLASRADEFTELGVLRTVYFDFDESELEETARRTLASNAGWIKSNPEFDVLIQGHCDERGTEEYNLALGDRRAGTVRAYLISLGVPAHRLRTISYGEEKPAARGDNEASWSQNRRAQFVVRVPGEDQG